MDKNKHQIIARILTGSRLYGTDTPESDFDYKSIYLPEAHDILLQRVKPVISYSTGNDKSKNTADDIDDEVFSLHKFFHMLTQGDTMATEILFAPASHVVVTSPQWQFIQSKRDHFLNRKCQGFVGYCRNQALKYSIKGERLAAVRAAASLLETSMEKFGTSAKVSEISNEIDAFVLEHTEFSRLIPIALPNGVVVQHWSICGKKLPYTISFKEAHSIMKKTFESFGERARQAETNQGIDWKAVSHAYRVAVQAKELLMTGTLTLPRPEASYIKDIKQGKIVFKQVGAEIDTLLEEVEIASQNSVLPPESDVVLMEEITRGLHYNKIVNPYEFG